ncbi:MAG: hypothetical protein PHY05_06580 [Methanothrix sp.]|nr:hypothetical protein [Methanothrix sp.]
MGIISDILKSLFSNKKRKKHGFHVSSHIDDDEEWSDEGDDSDSGDYGGDSGDCGGDGGDGGD